MLLIYYIYSSQTQVISHTYYYIDNKGKKLEVMREKLMTDSLMSSKPNLFIIYIYISIYIYLFIYKRLYLCLRERESEHR